MSVMNVKRSTHAFSNPKSDSAAPITKSEGTNSVGAEDFKKAFGEQNVGEIANKLADPNWIDPSKKTRAVGNDKLDKDAFMKLMLTQMKNQDPTKPMESHEMAAQLAQFTSLEQLNNMNSTLEAMKNAQTPTTNFQALAFIGKKVSSDSSKLTRTAGDTKHAFNFDLMGDAQKADVTVKDAAGNVVRKISFANLKKGANTVEWNGLQEDGLPARPGEYKFVVEAKGATGAKVYAKTSFDGRITGLNYTPEGPVLMVGGQTIKLSDVKKIEEVGDGMMGGGAPAMAMAAKAAPLAASQAAKGAQPVAPAVMALNGQPAASQGVPAAAQPAAIKTEAQVPNEEEIPPAEEPSEPAGNIGDIPMSRDLQSQLAKVMK
jgi:flagellar basal-body rod modification protein FlgD